MASGRAEITALVCGPSCLGDVVASSNILAEVSRPVVDPSLVVAPSIDIVGVADASREAQVGARPVVPSKPAECHMDMGLVAVHLVTVVSGGSSTGCATIVRSFASCPRKGDHEQVLIPVGRFACPPARALFLFLPS